MTLFDTMCKHEMDPASIVEDTERTWFCPEMDRRTRWNKYIPRQLRWTEGITMGLWLDFSIVHSFMCPDDKSMKDQQNIS